MRQGKEERTCDVTDCIADVAEQCVVELDQAAVDVLVAGRSEFAQHVRMTPDGALPVDDQAARQDVRAFHGDGDRGGYEAAPQVVVGSQADALAAVHIHGVVADLATQLRAVVLQYCGGYRRLLALVDRAGRDRYGGGHDVGVACDAGQRLADALEIRDRRIELLANNGVGARRIARCLAATCRGRR